MDPYGGAPRLGGSVAHLQRSAPPQPQDQASVVPVQLPSTCLPEAASPPPYMPQALPPTPPNQASMPLPRRGMLRRQLFGSGGAATVPDQADAVEDSASMDWAVPQPQQQRQRQPRKKRLYAAGSGSTSSSSDGLAAFNMTPSGGSRTQQQWGSSHAGRQCHPLQHAWSAPETALQQQYQTSTLRQQSGQGVGSSSSSMDWEPAEPQLLPRRCTRQQQQQLGTLFQGPVASGAQQQHLQPGSAFAGHHAYSPQSPYLQRHSAPDLVAPWLPNLASPSLAPPDTPPTGSRSSSSTSSTSGHPQCPHLAARSLHAGLASPQQQHEGQQPSWGRPHAHPLPRPFLETRLPMHAPHTPPGGIGPVPPVGHSPAACAPWLGQPDGAHAWQQQQQQGSCSGRQQQEAAAQQLDMLLRLYHLGMVSAFRTASIAQSAGAQAFARAEELCHAMRQHGMQVCGRILPLFQRSMDLLRCVGVHVYRRGACSSTKLLLTWQ